jgi:hypothetical protein
MSLSLLLGNPKGGLVNGKSILATLAEHGAEFVVVSPDRDHLRSSLEADKIDLELCFRQCWTNCECLTRALEQLGAREIPHRRIPLPWASDLRRANRALRFLLGTSQLTLRPAVRGLGNYESLLPHTELAEVHGCEVTVLARGVRRPPARSSSTRPEPRGTAGSDRRVPRPRAEVADPWRTN